MDPESSASANSATSARRVFKCFRRAARQWLERKAAELVEQNAEVERKNAEIEHARLALEDKASELAMTSRYKSEFLANMSHELRTPLNSILILGQQLAENAPRNLTDKQVEFASMIHAAGVDLMNLISDILDLSKIESGTVTIDVDNVSFAALSATVERTFRLEAERRKLGFQITLDPRLDATRFWHSRRASLNAGSCTARLCMRSRLVMIWRLFLTRWWISWRSTSFSRECRTASSAFRR